MRRWFPRKRSERQPSFAPGGSSIAPTWPDQLVAARNSREAEALAGRPPLRPSTDGAPTADQLMAWLRRWPDAPNDPTEFARWVNEPAPEGPHSISKFVFAVWRSRADLRQAFPGVPIDPEAQQRFLLWAHLFLADEAHAPADLVPDAPAGVEGLDPPDLSHAPFAHLQPGVVVVGMLRSVLGLGEAGRRLVRLCEQAGEVTRSVSFDYSDAPLGVPWTRPSPSAAEVLDIVVIAANGTEAPMLRDALGGRAVRGRYVIGLWFWELEDLSAAMAGGFGAVDEVWVTSEFTAEAVRRAATVGFPVQVLPLGADLRPAPTRTVASRARFGLPADAVVVGNVFDYASRIERKNPIGLINAWKRAFPVADPSRRLLFFKTLNATDNPESVSMMIAASDGRPDVIVRDEQLSAADRDLLVPQFDVVASLHRSEGYGLTLLEAMHHGLPVIASGYSGNLAFMTSENSWLVPCRPAFVEVDSLVSYPKGGRWADPDIDSAATMLREVVEHIDSVYVRSRAERGMSDIRALIDGSAGSAWIRDRLTQIRRDLDHSR